MSEENVVAYLYAPSDGIYYYIRQAGCWTDVKTEIGPVMIGPIRRCLPR